MNYEEARQTVAGFEDDDEWYCELHGDDPELCRTYDAEQAAEMRATEMLADALLNDEGGLT